MIKVLIPKEKLKKVKRMVKRAKGIVIIVWGCQRKALTIVMASIIGLIQRLGYWLGTCIITV